MKTSETLDDLLAGVAARGDLTAFASRAGIRPWTLLRLRQGVGTRTHRGTVIALARALRLPVQRVADAIDASRAAKAD